MDSPVLLLIISLAILATIFIGKTTLNHPMTNKAKLKALKTLLRYKKNWTRDAFARDKRNKPCEPDSRKACSYCIYGGCKRVGIENPGPLFKFLIRGIANFNDDPDTSHKDVLRAIDKAIKLCED